MRKRSTYRPKPVLTNPLAAMAPAPQAERERLMARFRSALESIARGAHPGEGDWRDLSDAINTVETLALHLHKLVPAEVMPTINVAIAALRDVLGFYEQCLEGLTEREMALAQAETQRRVNALLHARKPSADVIAL